MQTTIDYIAKNHSNRIREIEAYGNPNVKTIPKSKPSNNEIKYYTFIDG